MKHMKRILTEQRDKTIKDLTHTRSMLEEDKALIASRQLTVKRVEEELRIKEEEVKELSVSIQELNK